MLNFYFGQGQNLRVGGDFRVFFVNKNMYVCYVITDPQLPRSCRVLKAPAELLPLCIYLYMGVSVDEGGVVRESEL